MRSSYHMSFAEIKQCLRVLRQGSRPPTFTESQLRNALYITLGYFDGQGNPKSRRMKHLSGQK